MDAKLDSIDFDGLQCLVYVAGFQGAEFADYRTLDQAERISIKDLTAECQLIKSYKEDPRMLENAAMPISAVNYVTKRKKFKLKRQKRTWKKNQRNGALQTPMPPPNPRTRNYGTKSYQMKSIIAALRQDVQPHIEVEINGHPLSLLLGTGAMITLISKPNWNRLGKPQLQNSDTVVNAANGTRIPTDGRFEADFKLNRSDGSQHSGRGFCYVTENLDVFGWEWIQKIPDLVKPLQKYINGATIFPDPGTIRREEIVAKLKTDYADVFKVGLGRCTVTKATLQLKPDAYPVFIKKRPVP
ncbi:hypothetical protein Y032_0178g682 [Ancylostoma ceylanicum]|uniref:Uncharacterized protein n=1 Tax=Ancylostoma ceylanicum TaxID=53326 RepID=A0A016STK1_9BILA|nr:hypothetical protein Y032_0178g682 [Ancylostoma ceylanicum]